jgi:hypothetical protein
MTPSKEQLESQAKHFANTAFVVGAGVLILAASLLQPYAVSWMGSDTAGHLVFIAATICIFVLSSKRPELALYAIARQCKKYGHVVDEGTVVCKRCYKNVAAPAD